MKETWKQWLGNKGLDKWFQRDNLIILVLAGILLFIIALPTKDGGSKAAGEGADISLAGEKAGGEAGRGADKEADKKAAEGMGGEDITAGYISFSEEEYAAYLEGRLEEILSGISGVGKVQVMLTLSSSAELVVEKDEPYSRSQTNEADSEGGSRVITQMEGQENTVYRGTGNDSEPYVVKTLLPRVEGVVVVAQGSGKGTIDKDITEIAQALFGIDAHKIKVVKMKEAD